MGMGYVPAGPVPAEGHRDEFPGCQHRRAGARDRALANRRVARFGERLAADYLVSRGAKIVGRNVRVGRGEVDLLARFPEALVLVEVKTRMGEADPRQSFTAAKSEHLLKAAGRLRPTPGRIDFVGVSLTAAGADIRWIRGV